MKRSPMLVLFFVFAMVVGVARALPARDDLDPTAIVDGQIAQVKPMPDNCLPDAALLWLNHIGEIFDRIASGALPSLPPSAIAAVKTMSTEIVGNSDLVKSSAVVTKVAELFPSMWAMGFWYASHETWKALLSSVMGSVITMCKTKPSYDHAYDVLVNATSRVIRFTKDNVFMNGVDEGSIPNAKNRVAVEWLAEIVGSVSKVGGYTLTEPQLRAYMNSIPSKRDGMDMSVAFPVYVDTAKYKDLDAAALRAFLSTLPSSPTQSTQ